MIEILLLVLIVMAAGYFGFTLGRDTTTSAMVVRDEQEIEFLCRHMDALAAERDEAMTRLKDVLDAVKNGDEWKYR